MTILRLFPAVVVGAVLSAGLILACSDDSPHDADAASCDCPAAEAPLAGRIVERTDTIIISANGQGSGTAICPAGSTVLGGGCTVEASGAGVGNTALFDSGPRSGGYTCGWLSTVPNPSTAKATAFCLVPAT